MPNEEYRFERHFHWEFYSYNDDNVFGVVPNQQINCAAIISVVGYDTEDNARIAAREVIKRDTFILRHVWECTSCKFQEIQAANVREMVKSLKGK